MTNEEEEEEEEEEAVDAHLRGPGGTRQQSTLPVKASPGVVRSSLTYQKAGTFIGTQKLSHWPFP